MREGEVLDWLLEGMIDFRTLACSFGLSFVSWSLVVSECFLAAVISFLSLFLYFLCALMFWGVGFASLVLCSLCWCRICRLYFGLHHPFLRGFGVFSYFSMVVWMACWMCWKSSGVVALGCALCVFVIVVFMSLRIALLCFIYLRVERIFLVFLDFLGVCLWKMVRVGRWSDSGGEMVPAVTCVSVRVVRVGSMSVAVL